MRLGFVVLASALLVAPGQAQLSQQSPQPQLPLSIGPSFSENAINRDRFDAVFDVRVTLMPAVPLLRGQTDEARFDAVVCNGNSAGDGWVKANAAARFGVLQPGDCTMFSNFADIQLTTPSSGAEWMAKVFLRARK